MPGETLGAGGEITIQRGIPGIGEFQCYDGYMMADLKRAAEDDSEPEGCVFLPFCLAPSCLAWAV